MKKRKIKNIISVFMLVILVFGVIFLTKYTANSGKGLLEDVRSKIDGFFEYEATSSSVKNNSSDSSEAKDGYVDVEAVVLKRVIDGDTILVTDSDGNELRVRMIGVDTPESVNPDESKNTEEGEAASEFTKSMLNVGSTYYLEYDKGRTDKYGRTLAYVWLIENPKESQDVDYITENMYNAKLLANGYAKTMKIAPNTKYAGVFAEIEKSNNTNHGAWLFPGMIKMCVLSLFSM